MKPRLVVLTGAGISAESGIKTFRDAGGLWEEHRVEDVATPEAWARNPELVQNFYNERRRLLLKCEPNAAHIALAEAQSLFDVYVITQNVDDLHERAGSTQVIHLHGELLKAQSSRNPHDVYPIDGWELRMGDLARDGSQLRPHIVWFGEPVPMMEEAARIAAKAEYFGIIGTSLNVYPAAGLSLYAPAECPIFLVDPKPVAAPSGEVHLIREDATIGTPIMLEEMRRMAGI